MMKDISLYRTSSRGKEDSLDCICSLASTTLYLGGVLAVEYDGT